MAKEPQDQFLFDRGESWEEHWRGMPEFVQEDLRPFKSIMVHFESREDIEAFSKLVGQQIGLQTKHIWYPEAEIGRTRDKFYAAESASVLYRNKRRPK